MKKILLIALGAVALLLGSCTKDNNEITDPASPITGLEMPASSAEKPITAGEVVTINGKGFTASDEIWLSTATKAADEVKAEGFALTETGISFIAPAIDGEVSLTLKQNGKVHPLGKIFFAIKNQEPEPTNPITELEIPATSAEAPMIAGGTVAINGKGFTASDEIWLSTATKAADEVKAEGFALTETGISFTAPAIDGEVSLTLKQNGKAYPLGKIFFSTHKKLQERIFAVKTVVGVGGEGTSEFFEYDLAANALQPVFTYNGPARMILADNTNIYYVDESYPKTHLMCYNVKEKKLTHMDDSFDDTNWFLGIIDNKLHAMKYDETTGGFSLVSIAADGKHTLVKDFGQLLLDPTESFGRDEYPFVYDPVSKSILLDGALIKRSADKSYLKEVWFSFSTETRATTVKYPSLSLSETETQVFSYPVKDAVGMLLFTRVFTETSPGEDKTDTRITYIDPITLEKRSDAGTLEYQFDDPVYVSGKNMVLGICTYDYKDDDYGIWSYDLTTKNLQRVECGNSCSYLFTMYY